MTNPTTDHMTDPITDPLIKTKTMTNIITKGWVQIVMSGQFRTLAMFFVCEWLFIHRPAL